MATLKDFKRKHFQPEIIILCTRLYLRYPLSYRDLTEMSEERGLSVAHTTYAILKTRRHQARGPIAGSAQNRRHRHGF
jgi:transposase-like protein